MLAPRSHPAENVWQDTIAITAQFQCFLVHPVLMLLMEVPLCRIVCHALQELILSSGAQLALIVKLALLAHKVFECDAYLGRSRQTLLHNVFHVRPDFFVPNRILGQCRALQASMHHLTRQSVRHVKQAHGHQQVHPHVILVN